MKSRIWQGNICELENFVERMVTLATSAKMQIHVSLIPIEYKEELNNFNADSLNTKPLIESLAKGEKQIIRQTLIKHSWNQSQAARSIRISEQTIRYKMNKLGISRL